MVSKLYGDESERSSFQTFWLDIFIFFSQAKKTL